MKVLVTGASGFVGGHMIATLLAAGHDVRGLSRNYPTGTRKKQGAEYVDGVDVTVSTTLTDAMFQDVDAVVHLVGIIQAGPGNQTFQRVHVHGTGNVVDVARRVGTVAKFVYMSAIGSAPDAPAEYSRTKYEAEQLVEKSGIDYTIFRPSLVIGPDGEFVAQMSDLVKHGGLPVPLPFPAIPVVGAGTSKLQPVWADDLCAMVTKSLSDPRASDQVYEVGGATQLSFNELVTALAAAQGIHKPLLHAPVPVMNVVAGVMEALMPKPPVTRDQIANLGRDNITDNRAISTLYGITPLGFDQMLAKIYPTG